MSQNKSKTPKTINKSILIKMMVLKTLLDIKQALLNLSADRANLPLNRADITLHQT
jgi:hypothetical protein